MPSETAPDVRPAPRYSGILPVAVGLAIGAACGALVAWPAGYESGKAEARRIAEDAGAIPPAQEVREPLLSISGRVVSVDAGSMVIETAQIISNPFERQAPTTRTVRLASDTTITARVPRAADEYQADLARYEAAVDAADVQAEDAAKRPLPYAERTISTEELTVGSEVDVSADSDLTFLETISATKVFVTDLASVPAPAAAAADDLSATEPTTEPAE